MQLNPPGPLTKKVFLEALRELRQRDRSIDAIVSAIGPPGWIKRRSGFPALVRIILEQQVSLASGRAVFARLQETLPVLTPETFLQLEPEVLRQIGFSRQKIRYCCQLAQTICAGGLRLSRLETLPDGEVRDELTRITGIGRWTADIYLMEALKRPDIWPAGDLALAISVQYALKLKHRPSPDELDRIGKRWKPWRAVAARVFWHRYLSGPF
jgi:DNA-3-methyladenine glycosylase II